METDVLVPLERSSIGAKVATIGTFDGVHRGHQALLRFARVQADHASLPLAAITFDPPPAAILRPDQFAGAIVTARHKVSLLTEAGADEVIVLPFSEQFAHMSAESFLDRLRARAHVEHLYVGEEFALGRNRGGTVTVIAEIAAELGMQFRAIPRLETDRGIVSSSDIRRAVLRGNAEEAAALLGRWFRVTGEVIVGAQVGRTIGYPTANVLPEEELVQLADGIYATYAMLPNDNHPRPAMTYIGTRPALNTGRRLIETHLLDFDGDLYGQELSVDFVKRLRPDADFPSVDMLVAQLNNDEAQTRAALAAIGVQALAIDVRPE